MLEATFEKSSQVSSFPTCEKLNFLIARQTFMTLTPFGFQF